MERLTNANHKELGFCAYVGQKNPYSIPIIIGELSAPPNADYSPNAILVDVFEHLAAYEDTGLEPEEISGLCSMAERAKMADLLRLEEYQEIGSIDHLQELAQAEKDGRLVVMPVKEGTKIYRLGYRLGGTYSIEERYFSLTYFRGEILGKTIFLTRAEAEAALKKRGED